MKDIVNTKIKFREPFRPFAPSVIVDAAERYFDLPSPEKHYPARFMLFVVDVKPGQGEVLPAITHVDGTARLQTVHRDESPLYYGLIERFGAGERRAGDPQHLVQLEGRADRHDAGPGAQHVHAQRNGRPGAGELDRHQGPEPRDVRRAGRGRVCWPASA